ncbi:carbon-nitrogen hydrolase family protein [Alphaproteobacteria bacterium]|nr:carbon-nitrogen hydrolase family protein [Alphaproteobacteria bacterium]
MSVNLSLTCLQYTATKHEITTLKAIKPLINEAIDLGSDFIALPECATSLQSNPEITKKLSTTENDNISLQTFMEIAKANKLYILIGSLPIKIENKIANRSFLIGPSGNVLYKYDKIHLFDVTLPNGEMFKESNTYSHGSEAIIATIEKKKIIKIGMTICYDLRFPNLYQDLAQNGAEIITVPSAFSNITGPIHWHTLLKARAIETGCFIIAPAQTGFHQCGRKSFGHSLIISPWGKILADAGRDVCISNANVNLDEVKKARLAIPSLKSKKNYSTNF